MYSVNRVVNQILGSRQGPAKVSSHRELDPVSDCIYDTGARAPFPSCGRDPRLPEREEVCRKWDTRRLEIEGAHHIVQASFHNIFLEHVCGHFFSRSGFGSTDVFSPSTPLDCSPFLVEYGPCDRHSAAYYAGWGRTSCNMPDCRSSADTHRRTSDKSSFDILVS